MKRILFLTNYASPYRVNFFDELGKSAEVTVLFTDRSEDIRHRDAKWFARGQGGFRAVNLKGICRVSDEQFCPGVCKWLNRSYDAIVVGGYASPTVVLAMLWMRLRGIPFYMEVDGGLIRQESKAKFLVKKTLVNMAKRWLSTGSHTTEFLTHYGAKEAQIQQYPFSSLYQRDILTEVVSQEEKQVLREQLGIPEKKVILSVGQFIHRKGFDVLMHAAKNLDPETGIYIVGGEATQEYCDLRDSLGLTNVHFWGFRPKDQLALIYKAADLFVLPTREDIWGLVINEALAYGLPVITTDRCVAGLELVKDGVNGYLVPVEDNGALAEKLNRMLCEDMRKMGEAALATIRPYTLENMAEAHVKILEGGM